ncbi:hypothetical protein IAT40_003027 [Kwoniella sp. CBS 6097]
MPSSPSYVHRHHLLADLLGQQSVPQHIDRFQIPFNSPPSQSPERALSVSLDVRLLQAWSTNSKRRDQDALRHLDNLRVSQADFEILGRLGDGQFGVVNAVRCKLNGQVYAMKTMKKFAVMRAGPHLSLALERHIHWLAQNEKQPPIPKLIFAFQSETSISLVTTYANCGSLWDRLCSLSLVEDTPGCMSESEVKYWARQMVDAIAWVHGHGFVHRDVKPHNFVVTSQSRILLTDFGSAAILQDPTGARTSSRPYVAYESCLLPVGTPDYIPPEILRIAESALIEAAESQFGRSESIHTSASVGYDLTVDWWSLGSTLFEMTTGQGPFLAPTIQETYNKLINYEGILEVPASMSWGLRKLLQGLLSLPESRLSSQQAIVSQPFFGESGFKGYASQAIDLSILPIVEDTYFDSTMTSLTASTNSSCPTDDSFTTMYGPDTGAGQLPEHLLRWVGWSWQCSPDFLDSDRSTENTNPQVRRAEADLSPTSYTTPLRRDGYREVDTYQPPPFSTIRRAIPGSHARQRAISESRALQELIECVQRSAKKQIASSRKGSSTRSNGQCQYPRERSYVPPTPTPLYREASSLLEQRSSTRALDRTASRQSNVSRRSASVRPSSLVSVETLEVRYHSMERGLDQLESRLSSLRGLTNSISR